MAIAFNYTFLEDIIKARYIRYGSISLFVPSSKMVLSLRFSSQVNPSFCFVISSFESFCWKPIIRHLNVLDIELP